MVVVGLGFVTKMMPGVLVFVYKIKIASILHHSPAIRSGL